MLSKEKSTEDLDNSKKSRNFAGNLDFSQENGYFSIKMTYMTSKTTYSPLQKAYTIVLMLILSWGLAMPAHCQRTNTDTSDQSELSELEDGSKLLFERFEQRFISLDSLIFDTNDSVNHHDNNHIGNALFIANSDTLLYAKQDSLVNEQVAAEVRAMKHETGLSLTGQTYYRLDQNLALDEDDAVSRYVGKVQVELRWNFLNSGLLHRKGRVHALELSGEIARVGMEKQNIAQLVALHEEYYRTQYDSLLSGILQHRLENLNLMNEAQMYLLGHGNISSDEMLNIINDKAETERALMAIATPYPIANNLSNAVGLTIDVDSMALIDYVNHHYPDITLLSLQSELLAQQKENESYWSSMSVSPFIRYSYYFRTDLPNSSNVDLGINFSIPLSGEANKKRAAMDAERMVVEMKKEEMQKKIAEDIRLIVKDIARLNLTSTAELGRMRHLQTYLAIRSNAYQNRKGGYNIILRTKEYNTYLLCWEKFLRYQYERDCLLMRLQMYLPDISVFDFCTAEKIMVEIDNK